MGVIALWCLQHTALLIFIGVKDGRRLCVNVLVFVILFAQYNTILCQKYAANVNYVILMCFVLGFDSSFCTWPCSRAVYSLGNLLGSYESQGSDIFFCWSHGEGMCFLKICGAVCFLKKCYKMQMLLLKKISTKTFLLSACQGGKN